jgi:hypothetical protein
MEKKSIRKKFKHLKKNKLLFENVVTKVTLTLCYNYIFFLFLGFITRALRGAHEEMREVDKGLGRCLFLPTV